MKVFLLRARAADADELASERLSLLLYVSVAVVARHLHGQRFLARENRELRRARRYDDRAPAS